VITHTIIKHRPRVRAPSVPHIPTNNYNGWVSHRKLATSDEFLAWIAQHPFTFGTLVALNPDEIKTPNQVHMIIGINTDYHMLDWDRGSQLPKCFEVIQLQPSAVSLGRWKRWDSPSGYRLLSDKETAFIKENHNDSVQDCLELCPRSANLTPGTGKTG
jgi:hypothetical protein